MGKIQKKADSAKKTKKEVLKWIAIVLVIIVVCLVMYFVWSWRATSKRNGQADDIEARARVLQAALASLKDGGAVADAAAVPEVVETAKSAHTPAAAAPVVSAAKPTHTPVADKVNVEGGYASWRRF
jgi:flagellar basal body-associated protein FliL